MSGEHQELFTLSSTSWCYRGGFSVAGTGRLDRTEERIYAAKYRKDLENNLLQDGCELRLE